MDHAPCNFVRLFDLSGRVALITGAGAGFAEQMRPLWSPE
jgi:hypothetical protein